MRVQSCCFAHKSNSAARSYYLKTRNSDKQTEINISESLTFVWLLLLKYRVCLSFVIKITKMTKLRQKLQIGHFDVIRVLRYCYWQLMSSSLLKIQIINHWMNANLIKCYAHTKQV